MEVERLDVHLWPLDTIRESTGDGDEDGEGVLPYIELLFDFWPSATLAVFTDRWMNHFYCKAQIVCRTPCIISCVFKMHAIKYQATNT